MESAHHLPPWSPRPRGRKDHHHPAPQVTACCHKGPPNWGWGLSGHFHHATPPKGFLSLFDYALKLVHRSQVMEERGPGGFQKGPGNSKVYWVLCWVVEGCLISSSAAWRLGVADFEDLQKRCAGAERLCRAPGLTCWEKALYFYKTRCRYYIICVLCKDLPRLYHVIDICSALSFLKLVFQMKSDAISAVQHFSRLTG